VLSTLTMSTEEAPDNGVELEKLLLVIQSGLRVRARHHFFNWTQGAVQTLLPHDLLVCAVAEAGKRSYRIESFSCYPEQASRGEALNSREGGLVQRLAQLWEKGGCNPLLHREKAGAGPIAALLKEVAMHRLGSFVAHGICGFNGAAGTFFVFCALPAAPVRHIEYVAELLVPYMHAAWQRVQLQQDGAEPAARPAPRAAAGTEPASEFSGLLTARELEILHWVGEGKSNMETGMILGISGLTVKNHVQNILRKLKVQNRTQAISKCMSLNLLHPKRGE